MEAELGVAFGPFSESYISTVTCVPDLSVEVGPEFDQIASAGADTSLT